MGRVAGCGGIILCGGGSTRMGRDKAALPFGPELLLQRIVRILGEVVDPIVVAAAADQQLPELPATILVTRDAHAHRGPLEGLLAGLSLIRPRVSLVFVVGCDTPLLEPGFVRRLAEKIGDSDVAAVAANGLVRPLPALYRVAVHQHVSRQLHGGQLRLGRLLEQARTCLLAPPDFLDVDPELHSLRNMNHPSDYAQALTIAGLGIDACLPPGPGPAK